jgi:regulator of protease activity HflC (stomatin/prohibitin superfamily)
MLPEAPVRVRPETAFRANTRENASMNVVLIPVAVVGVIALISSMRVMMEYERGVIFRLGKLIRAKGPGLIFILPFGIERLRKMDLRIVALDLAPQETITKDNVTLKVNAVVYFRVIDPSKAVVEIEDYYFATSQLAQTTLRSVIGQSELDDLLAERERLNEQIRGILDDGTEQWGIEVTGVEIKDIDLPQEMKRAMAKQAEAERERRAKIIAADGEFLASAKLAQAAAVIEEHPAALQLRYLQTVAEIATENNSTTLFPIPIELFAGMIKSTAPRAGASAPAGEPSPEAGPARLPPGGDPGELARLATRALGLGAPSGARAPDDTR